MRNYYELNKNIWVILMMILFQTTIYGQSSNFRAQGKYYTAKEHYEFGRYTQAMVAIKESKSYLGGTNYQLQYLHVMSAYYNKNYAESQKEMGRYFNLIDGKESVKSFSKGVEELTVDETKALTKLIDKIDSHVENNSEAKLKIQQKKKTEETSKSQRRADVLRYLNDKLDGLTYNFSSNFSYEINFENGNNCDLKIYWQGKHDGKTPKSSKSWYEFDLRDIDQIVLTNNSNGPSPNENDQLKLFSKRKNITEFYYLEKTLESRQKQREFILFGISNTSDRQRILKAFKELKSLCDPDPFD